MPKILVALLSLSLLILVGCTIGPKVESITIWAKRGTPCRIIDSREIAIEIPNDRDARGNVVWSKSNANLAGMVAIDEATLDYYRSLDSK